MTRGSESQKITRGILELFVEYESLRAKDVCDLLCSKYALSRKAIRSRLQRLRDIEALWYVDEKGRAMALRLHGEYMLLALRKESGDERSPMQRALSTHTRWGQRRKNAYKKEGA
jgi:hypothetical protein